MPRKSKRSDTMRKNKKVNRTKKMRGGVWYDPRSWFGNSTTQSVVPSTTTSPAAELTPSATSSTATSDAPITTQSTVTSPPGPGGKSKKRVKRN